MKEIIFLITFLLVLLNLNACENQREAKSISTPNLVSSIESKKKDPIPINSNEDLNTSCRKSNTPRNKLSFKNLIKKVKIGFYTREVTRHRAVAKKECIGKKVDPKRFTKIVTLEENNLEELYPILLNYTKGDLSVAHCYEPRHYIWFEDSEERIISCIEICFQCSQLRDPKGEIEIECNEQLDELHKFVKSLDK
jgi:hypothetical protein